LHGHGLTTNKEKVDGSANDPLNLLQRQMLMELEVGVGACMYPFLSLSLYRFTQSKITDAWLSLSLSFFLIFEQQSLQKCLDV
jgi:23S rRNA A1618 N6-methylase RlmF